MSLKCCINFSCKRPVQNILTVSNSWPLFFNLIKNTEAAFYFLNGFSPILYIIIPFKVRHRKVHKTQNCIFQIPVANLAK